MLNTIFNYNTSKKLDEINRKINEKIIEKEAIEKEAIKKEAIEQNKKIVETYYKILADVINNIVYDKKIDILNENKLKNLDSNYIIKEHNSLFIHYMHIYIYIRFILLKYIYDNNQYDNFYANLLLKYYRETKVSAFSILTIFISEKYEKILVNQEALFTIIFDYIYIAVRAVSGKYENTELFNINEILDEENCKKNSTYARYVNEMKKCFPYSYILYNDYFPDSKKYLMYQIYENIMTDQDELIIKKYYHDIKNYNEEELYNICSDDFLFESVNLNNINEYDMKKTEIVFNKYVKNELSKYDIKVLDKNYYNDVDVEDITKDVCILHLVLYKKNSETTHACLLISEFINNTYNMYFFCPNGLLDIAEYKNELIHIKQKIYKHFVTSDTYVKFKYLTLIKNQNIFNDISVFDEDLTILNENLEELNKNSEELNKNSEELNKKAGYVKGLQNFLASQLFIYKRIRTDYGTCYAWCCLFIEIYIKLHTKFNSTPLDTYRYIVKKYNDVIKLGNLLDDYIVYIHNDKLDTKTKNNELAKYNYKQCSYISEEEYKKNYEMYIKENKNSPIYRDIEISKYNLLPEDYFLFKYNNKLIYNDIQEDIYLKYIEIINTKLPNIHIINNNQLYTENQLFDDKIHIQLYNGKFLLFFKADGKNNIYLFGPFFSYFKLATYEINEYNARIYMEKYFKQNNIPYELIKFTNYKILELIIPEYLKKVVNYICLDIIIKNFVYDANKLNEIYEDVLLKIKKNTDIYIKSFMSYINQIVK